MDNIDHSGVAGGSGTGNNVGGVGNNNSTGVGGVGGAADQVSLGDILVTAFQSTAGSPTTTITGKNWK